MFNFQYVPLEQFNGYLEAAVSVGVLEDAVAGVIGFGLVNDDGTRTIAIQVNNGYVVAPSPML